MTASRNGTKAAEPDSRSDGRLIAQMSNRGAVAVEMMNGAWPGLLPPSHKTMLRKRGKLFNHERLTKFRNCLWTWRVRRTVDVSLNVFLVVESYDCWCV